MKFTDKLNKIEGKTYTVEEEIIVTNGKYEGFLGHDNININTLVIYTEKGLKGDKITNYSLSVKEDATWKTFIELYHPTNVYATYEITPAMAVTMPVCINCVNPKPLNISDLVFTPSGIYNFCIDSSFP